MAKEGKREFILKDFSRNPIDGVLKNEKLRNVNVSKWLGHCLAVTPFEAHTVLDFTGAPGSVSGLYYSLVFQLRKWEYWVEKADEWIEVSPVHAQYFQLTHKQKEDLEARIKSGLASAAQSVADLELLMHDERKYREFLRYLGYRTHREIDEEKGSKAEVSPPYYDELNLGEDDKTRKKRIDEHSLKAVFVDQVDIHTGEGISIRSIVSRWPTLIIDFLKLNDDDIVPEDVMKRLDISKAEAVVLVTKNKLYLEWKNIFCHDIVDRYRRISDLVKSRERSVEEYKEWLKPIIARHKLIEEGLSKPGIRSMARTSWIGVAGQAVSMASVDIWTWKPLTVPEFFKGGTERLARELSEAKIDPYDEWTKRNLIFHPEDGLIVEYPWITDKWVQERKKDIFNNGWLAPHKLYYNFLIINFSRTNIRSPTGSETEDGMFDVNAVLMSQNAMFVKLLELFAKKDEFNSYVDSLLGIRKYPEGKRLTFEEKGRGPVTKFFDYFSMPFQFMKHGPYERDFDDRITNYYAAALAGGSYQPVVGFLKRKMGFGVS